MNIYQEIELPFPAEMVVDYVRVYQAPDTAERFAYTFVDDFTGWQQITIPFEEFSRGAAVSMSSAEQPDGAPNDGLGLTEVWGYSFDLPTDSSGAFLLDQVSQTKLNNNVPTISAGGIFALIGAMVLALRSIRKK